MTTHRHYRFEAAWQGNLDKIKELTLANWGPDLNDPLHVATQDSHGFTPFALALYRRHFDVAKHIVEIANLQYKDAKEDKRKRYTIKTGYSDDEDEFPEDNEDYEISSEVIDETYTFENVAALRKSAGSKISGMLDSVIVECLGS